MIYVFTSLYAIGLLTWLFMYGRTGKQSRSPSSTSQWGSAESQFANLLQTQKQNEGTTTVAKQDKWREGQRKDLTVEMKEQYMELLAEKFRQTKEQSE